ncbi:hypothetical protein LZ30DRAFT_233696 [Colletotrichum cereale]|nr:hypothetical protein LZ30DRAFT_233696 [Colletotrichum cereale]
MFVQLQFDVSHQHVLGQHTHTHTHTHTRARARACACNTAANALGRSLHPDREGRFQTKTLKCYIASTTLVVFRAGWVRRGGCSGSPTQHVLTLHCSCGSKSIPAHGIRDRPIDHSNLDDRGLQILVKEILLQRRAPAYNLRQGLCASSRS